MRSERPISDAPAATVRIAYVAPAPIQPQQNDPATLFYDDFEAKSDLSQRYFEYDRAGGSFLCRVGEGYAGKGAAMRCQFEKGQVAAGSLKVLFGKNPLGRGIHPEETYREIYWRVYVKHEAGWTGNPAKLGRATCLAGSDWSQGFIAHVWGGKDDTLCIDPATGIRDGKKVTEKYNDFTHLHWLGLRNGKVPIFSTAESGRWVPVESHIKLNTPGHSDGVFELWVDGKLEAMRTDLDWHGTWTDYAINAVFLENYWNTGSIRRQARWLDNFVISTRPIAPIVALQPVMLTRTPLQNRAWQTEAAMSADTDAVVWRSQPLPAGAESATIDTTHGTFTGSRAGQQSLAADKTHWLRVRERLASGEWSSWSEWHSPFHTVP